MICHFKQHTSTYS